MMKLGTIVTVVLAALVPSLGLRVQEKDVLQLLEVLKIKDDIEARQLEVEGNQSEDDSEENNIMDGLLKKMEVIDFIEKTDKGASKTKFGEIKLTGDELQKDEYGDYELVASNQGNDMIEELVHGKGPIDFQKKNHHVLTPSNLLGASQIDDGHRDPKDPLNEYNKVYVVLDPVALENNKKNDALSKLLYALSPSLTEMTRQNKRNRNNRFNVKSNLRARRYRRDSIEGYEDDEYKPQRKRHDDSGNGHGGGRTGIPYMRPRGDIYEKN